MWFYLTAIDPQNQTRKFSFHMELLEKGFDFLNRLVAEGQKLITVQLVDGQSITNLPIKSFDGDPSVEQIEELERVWKSILEKPSLPIKVSQAAQLSLANQRLLACQDQIGRIEPLLIRVVALLTSSQKMNISLDAKHMLETNYQHTLSLYHTQLDRAYLTRQGIRQLIHHPQ